MIVSILCRFKSVASRTLSIKILTDISCNSCFQSSPTEDCCVILQLPIRANIQSSLNSLFISECLEGVNAPFCHVCSSKQDADSPFYICELGNYLIVQLKRFLAFLFLNMQFLLFVHLTWMFWSMLMMRCHALESLLWCWYMSFWLPTPWSLHCLC